MFANRLVLTVVAALFLGLVGSASAQTDSPAPPEFGDSSGIDSIEATPDTIQDLVVLGKVWGLVKYHHPALVKQGGVNWDYELFRVLPKYLAAESNEQQSAILVDWINALGPVEPGEPLDTTGYEFRLRPDNGWVDKLESKQLAKLLRAIVDTRRQGEQPHFTKFNRLGFPEFKEEPYGQFEYPDAGYRLLALYRYWNIVQYYSPYRDLPDIPWSQTLEDFVPKFLDAEDALAYQLTIMRLAARLQDGHCNRLDNAKSLNQRIGHKWPVVNVSFIEGELVVDRILDEKARDSIGLQVGDVIKSINGEPVEKNLEWLESFIPASNKANQLRYIAGRILKTNRKLARVEYQRHGEDGLRKAKIPCVPAAEYFALRRQANVGPAWEVKDKIGFIHVNRFEANTPSLISKELGQVDGVVIDLREISKTDLHTLAGLFLSEWTYHATLTLPSPFEPGAFAYFPDSVGPPRWSSSRKTFEGKVAILVSEWTQSATEYKTMALRVLPNARVFGSTTAGADGNVTRFDMPGGLRTQISGVGIYTPEKKETQRVGIIADVRVEPTLDDIRQGKDRILETALEWIRSEEKGEK